MQTSGNCRCFVKTYLLVDDRMNDHLADITVRFLVTDFTVMSSGDDAAVGSIPVVWYFNPSVLKNRYRYPQE